MTQETNKGWEERFDERFTPDWWMGFGTSDDINEYGIGGLKAFIHTELQRERDWIKNEYEMEKERYRELYVKDLKKEKSESYKEGYIAGQIDSMRLMETSG